VFTDTRTSSPHQLLIATSHLDYTPQIRATQFASVISTLSATPTTVFCGDTNIDTYLELEPLLSAGYVDSWLDTHSDFANSPDLREVGVTFGTAGLRGSHSPSKGGGPPRRLDYVMARSLKVKKCELVGDKPIPKERWITSSEEQELELEVYVSDHLGMLVDVELA
jgi:endonuclease/exonuclease/phosphatase family metal-dependent hydrolase